MKYQPRDRSALVAYGSETGNAYDYAEELGRFLERIHFSTHVSKLDAIETARVKNPVHGQMLMEI